MAGLTLRGKASPADAAALSLILQAERDECAAFVGLLQTEQDVLIRDDAESLALLASEKSGRIERLNRLGEQRNACLETKNPSADASGMISWLGRNPTLSATVASVWRELLALGETARQINLVNGALIESALGRSRQKLAVLLHASGSDGVYRPDGQMRATHNSRTLSQA